MRVDPELEVRQQGSVDVELIPLVLDDRPVRRGVVALQAFDKNNRSYGGEIRE